MEIHHLSRWQELRNWIDAALAVFCLLMVLGFVQAQDDAAKARTELNYRKTIACPTEIEGRPFQWSAYEAVNLSKPGTAKLTCFYRRES